MVNFLLIFILQIVMLMPTHSQFKLFKETIFFHLLLLGVLPKFNLLLSFKILQSFVNLALQFNIKT